MDILYQIGQTKYKYDSKETDKEQIGGWHMCEYVQKSINTGKAKESLCKSAKIAKIAMNEPKTVPKDKICSK
jgi:hypothetical protein